MITSFRSPLSPSLIKIFGHIKCVVKKIKFIFLFLTLFFTSTAYANTCHEFLSVRSYFNSLDLIDIPGRGNQITKDEFNQLSEDNKYRVAAIKSALDVLDKAPVVQALISINQPLSYFIGQDQNINPPEGLLKIVTGQPIKDQMLDHYAFFYNVLSKYNYPEETLVGLTLLFGDIKRPRKPIQTIFTDSLDLDLSNDKQLEMAMEYFRKTLENPQNARAVITFLKNPYVQLPVQMKLNSIAETLRQDDLATLRRLQSANPGLDQNAFLISSEKSIQKDTTLDPDVIEAEYKRNKKFSKSSLIQISTMLRKVSEMIITHYNDLIKKIKASGDPNSEVLTNFKDMFWQSRMTLMEDYLSTNLGFKSNLDDLISFIDHLIFGSSLQIKTEDLENQIHGALKKWLMPVRSQISGFNIKTRTQKELEAQNVRFEQTRLLNPDWGHRPSESSLKTGSNTPRLNPNKRKNNLTQKNIDQSSTSTTSLDEKIPDSVNLFNFSPFSSSPRPLNELDHQVIYKLRFMRDGEHSKVYTVEFTKEVIKDLQDIPEVSSKLMRALNLGFARSVDQIGLVILARNLSGNKGRLYELKIRKIADTRVLMHLQNGHWKVVKVTDKTNLDRAVDKFL